MASETDTRWSASPDIARMRLIAVCPDRVGIIAAVARCLADMGANIESSHQFSADPADGTFFLRMEFAIPFLAAGELRQRLQDRRRGSLPDALADPRGRRSQAHRRARLAPGPLPDRAPMALAQQRARRRDRRGRLRPRRAAGGGRGARAPVPPRAAGRRDANRRRGGAARRARGGVRPRRSRALPAGALRRLRRPHRRADHQHPPLVPAGVPGPSPTSWPTSAVSS